MLWFVRLPFHHECYTNHPNKQAVALVELYWRKDGKVLLLALSDALDCLIADAILVEDRKA